MFRAFALAEVRAVPLVRKRRVVAERVGVAVERRRGFVG
jgi:hypothetical protein